MGVQTRKELKKNQSESRQTRKRKRDETVTDLPEADQNVEGEVTSASASRLHDEVDSEERSTKRKKGKSKRGEISSDAVEEVIDTEAVGTRGRTAKKVRRSEVEKVGGEIHSVPLDAVALAKAKQREKNQKAKEKRKAKAKAEKAALKAEESAAVDTDVAESSEKSQRFIVFIGESCLWVSAWLAVTHRIPQATFPTQLRRSPSASTLPLSSLSPHAI